MLSRLTNTFSQFLLNFFFTQFLLYSGTLTDLEWKLKSSLLPKYFLPLGVLVFLNFLNFTVVFYCSHRLWIETEFPTISPNFILPPGFLKFLNFNSCILWLSPTMREEWTPYYSSILFSIKFLRFIKLISVLKYKQIVRFSYLLYSWASIGINSLLFCSHRRFLSFS